MAAPTEQQVTRVVAGYDRAKTYADYADTIVFDTEQIEGTRYKYILCGQNIFSEVDD